MGEANIFRMMRDFYDELEKSELRPLFPADMDEASKKSAAFFVTILGGPPLYAQKYGSPRMRATVSALERSLVLPGGGALRHEDDDYAGGGNPWLISTNY